MLYEGGLFAQFEPSCLFISKKGDDARDSLLIVHLEKKYDVTVISDGAFYDSVLTVDSLKQYDFGFFSESVRTWTLEFGVPQVKTVPIPMFLLEGYMSKSILMGWTTQPADTGFGTVTDSLALNNGNKVLIVDDTGHDLSAGFGLAEEVTVNSQAHVTSHANLTFTVPEIDHIPIAVSSMNPEWTVVMGVETGTTVWNDDGTELTVSDTTVTQNRAALVGIHANVNEFITEDGYKLIDAGIEWILGGAQEPTDDFVTKAIESQSGRFMAEFNRKNSSGLAPGFLKKSICFEDLR